MNIHGYIEPPARTTAFGTAIILFNVVLCSLYPFVRPALPWLALLAAVSAACSLFAESSSQPLHLSLFTFFLLSTRALRRAYAPDTFLAHWPFALFMPLLLYLAVVVAFPRLRRSLSWLKTGRLDRGTILSIAGIAIVAAAALYLWVQLAEPDLSHHLKNIPPMPAWFLPCAGLGFALTNALLEEAAFRGIVMHALDSAFGSRNLSIFVQAWLFGVIHFLRGFPNGWPGLILAALYGLMLGWLRSRTRGMAAPFLSHVIADLIIFAILASRLSLE